MGDEYLNKGNIRRDDIRGRFSPVEVEKWDSKVDLFKALRYISRIEVDVEVARPRLRYSLMAGKTWQYYDGD
jgi:hypothetical protein